MPRKRENHSADLTKSKPAAKAAAQKARRLLKRMERATAAHPYLKQKGVPPGPCRVSSNGKLVVPMRDAATDKLKSLQLISVSDKKFLKGSATKGSCCVLGDLDSDDPLVIAEGFATAASIQIATGWPTVAAFSCGNIPPVAKAMRERFPERDIIIAGDNDCETPRNPGRTDAIKASRLIKARCAIPPGHGDFNDLHLAEGLDVVRENLERAEFNEALKADQDFPENVIAELALLNELEYEQARKSIAQDLNFRVSKLDTLVQELRKAQDEGGGLKFLEATEPWPTPVNGLEIADKLVDIFHRYCVLPDGAADALALWVFHAHTHDAFEVSPILCLSSPEKRCGKTTALRVLQGVVPKALPASNVTKATVFRSIEKWKPTLLVDEFDTFSRNNEELRGVLDSGHIRPFAYVLRCVGDDLEPRPFSTWAPKAIALIGRLPPTLEDRSIKIAMQRKLPDEKILRLKEGKDKFKKLRRKLARWAKDHLGELKDSAPRTPKELHDRAADNWRPLLAIADLIGGAWPTKARQVAWLLEKDVDDEAAAIMLLEDIKAVFEDIETGKIPSKDLCAQLHEREDRPWPEWKKGKPITQTQVARLLKPFKVYPRQIWLGRNYKGYHSKDFTNVFARYLPKRDARTLDGADSAAFKGKQEARRTKNLAPKKHRKRKPTARSSGLAGQSTPRPAERTRAMIEKRMRQTDE